MVENYLDRLAKVKDRIRRISSDGNLIFVGDTGLFIRFSALEGNWIADFMPGGSGIEARDRAEAAYYAGKFRIGLGALHERLKNVDNVPHGFILTDKTQLRFTTKDRFASAIERLFSANGHAGLVTREDALVFHTVHWYNVSVSLKKFLELPDNDELIRYLNAIRYGKLGRPV